jgi:hypothetical protein
VNQYGGIRQFAKTVWRWVTVKDGVLLIPMAALIACLPIALRGVSCGHDFEFHLVSWMEAKRAWGEHVLYPHWAQSPNWGAGEPRFVFYPPLTWMLGAALGTVVPWEWVPAIFTFLFLAGAGFATRALVREFLPAPVATAAGCLATATPYAFFSAFERTAYSELAAAIWIPLLLLFALRKPAIEESKRRAVGSATMLALVLAATWLTNAPAGVMASYLLAFAALVAAIVLRAWWPVLRASVAAAVGIGLAGFYLVPAAWEQRWIAIHQALDVGMRVADSWLFAHHLGPDLELHDHVLVVASSIVVLTVGLAAVGFGVSLLKRRLTRESRHIWLPLALLIPVLFLLQFSISAPVWNALPKLQFLQFPWRWLTVLGTPFAIFLALATPLGSRRARCWSALVWAVILIAFAAVSTLTFVQYCDDEDQISNQLSVFQDGTGVDGTDEYAALGTDNTLVASGLPDGCLVDDALQDLGEGDSNTAPVWAAEQGSCNVTYTAQLWQNEHKRLQFNSDQDGFVILRLRHYPAWLITVNGRALTQLPAQREDGLVVVPIKEGASTIDIRWATTQDVLWGRWVSLGALLLLVILWLAERRLAGRPASGSLATGRLASGRLS